MTTVNITDPTMMDRQHRMIGLGVTPQMIAAMIAASDEEIAKSIEAGKAAVARLSGEQKDRAANFVKAFEIEAAARA